MSIQTPNREKSTESTDEPRVLTVDQYERRSENYARLVAELADAENLTAAESKQLISEIGRNAARERVQQ